MNEKPDHLPEVRFSLPLATVWIGVNAAETVPVYVDLDRELQPAWLGNTKHVRECLTAFCRRQPTWAERAAAHEQTASTS